MARQVIIAQTPEVTAQELKSTTSILPVKTTNYIMQDAVPSGNVTTEYASNYLFDDVIFPNTEEVKSVYCEVVYIDNNKEITKNIKLEYIDNTPLVNETNMKCYQGIDEDNNFGIAFCSHYYAESEIEKCNIAVCTDLGNNTFAEVKKLTIYYNTYSNLLKNEHIESINYSKIDNFPIILQSIDNGYKEVLDFKEKLQLKKNLINWSSSDINLYNQAPYTTDAPNNVFKDMKSAKNGLKILAKKPALGKGIKIEDFSYSNAYYFYYTRSADVIIDIVDSNGKIITTLNDYEYEKGNLKFSSLGAWTADKGVDAYIIFSIKEDSTEDFNAVGFMYLITMGSEILTYDDLDNKVDKVKGKQLSTNDFTNELKTKLEGLENSIPRINPTTTAELYDMVCSKDGLYYIEGEFSDVIDDTSEYVYIHGLISTENVEGDGLLYIICFENLIQVNIRIENKVIARVDYMHVLTQFLLQSQLWGGKKGQVLTKLSNSEKGYYTWADIPQLSFDADGNLVVTIDGVSKTFVPKEETVQASYNSETETISLNAE